MKNDDSGSGPSPNAYAITLGVGMVVFDAIILRMRKSDGERWVQSNGRRQKLGNQNYVLHRRDLAVEFSHPPKRQARRQRYAYDPFQVIAEPHKVADVITAALRLVEEIAGFGVTVG